MRKEKFSPKNLKISEGIPPEARKSPFWKRVLELLSAPSRARRGVNVGRLSANVPQGAVVVVPDKVLGAGAALPKLTVAAVAFSAAARKAIQSAGGMTMGIAEAAKRHPAGKGVLIIK